MKKLSEDLKEKAQAFFKAEQKRWAEASESLSIFGAPAAVTASLICGSIAEGFTNGDTEKAKRYLEGLKKNEPQNFTEEAGEILQLLL